MSTLTSKMQLLKANSLRDNSKSTKTMPNQTKINEAKSQMSLEVAQLSISIPYSRTWARYPLLWVTIRPRSHSLLLRSKRTRLLWLVSIATSLILTMKKSSIMYLTLYLRTSSTWSPWSSLTSKRWGVLWRQPMSSIVLVTSLVKELSVKSWLLSTSWVATLLPSSVCENVTWRSRQSAKRRSLKTCRSYSTWHIIVMLLSYMTLSTHTTISVSWWSCAPVVTFSASCDVANDSKKTWPSFSLYKQPKA